MRRRAWEQGNGVSDVRASEIDRALHRERSDRGSKGLHPLPMPISAPPDGAMLQADDNSFLVLNGRALPRSFAGYGAARADLAVPLLLTPPSTLRALHAGYRPVPPPSAHASSRG